MSQDGGGDFNGREQFMSSSAALTINVLDQQDTPPSFLGTPYFGYVYEVSLPVSKRPAWLTRFIMSRLDRDPSSNLIGTRFRMDVLCVF